MRARLVLSILLVFLISFPIILLVQASGINVDYNYCSVTQLDAIYISCREDYLFSQYNLWLDVFPGVKRVIIQRSLTIEGFKIQIILSNGTESGLFTIRLPPYREYSNVMVVGWNLTVFYWVVYNGTGYIQEANYILRAETWSQSGWEWTYGDLHVIGIRLRPITSDQPGQPSEPPSIPEWSDFWGWVNFLIYLLSEVAKAVPIAISVFVNAVAYLIQISPFLLVIIPLHILLAFVHDPVEGVKAIGFYIGLGRKLIDLLVKIVQAIVSIIDALIPT
jgi:hypothetical protein